MANCTEFLLHFPEREPSKLWPLYYGLFHYFLVEPENMKTNTKVKKLLKYTFTVEERVSFGIAYLFLKRHNFGSQADNLPQEVLWFLALPLEK